MARTVDDQAVTTALRLVTEFDALEIHFRCIRSKHEDASPMIITQEWPGSVEEQAKPLDPDAEPTAHGASTAEAFHLVFPSMPGYYRATLISDRVPETHTRFDVLDNVTHFWLTETALSAGRQELSVFGIGSRRV